MPLNQRSTDETVDHEKRVAIASQRARSTLIIVTGDCAVLLDSIGPTEYELRFLLNDERTKLREQTAHALKPLMAGCLRKGESQLSIASLDERRFLRVTRLDGVSGVFFAISVEFFRDGDSLSRARRKYQLTNREIEVLALMLEGANTAETARALSIAESTVQGYWKRLLAKTKSRNRAAMVANVLDWRG